MRGSEGGWRFVTPQEGMQLVDKGSGEVMAFRSGAWESGVVHARELRVNGTTVVREQQSAISDPSGGATTDSECRAAVLAILTSLRAHGLIG